MQRSESRSCADDIWIDDMEVEGSKPRVEATYRCSFLLSWPSDVEDKNLAVRLLPFFCKQLIFLKYKNRKLRTPIVGLLNLFFNYFDNFTFTKLLTQIFLVFIIGLG